MDDSIAGTVLLHTIEKGLDEKTTVIAEHNEIVQRTASGDVYVTRNDRQLVPTHLRSSGQSLPCIDQRSLLPRLRERAVVGIRTDHLGSALRYLWTTPGISGGNGDHLGIIDCMRRGKNVWRPSLHAYAARTWSIWSNSRGCWIDRRRLLPP